MRVAIVENTAVTHHGQVGVALHEKAHRIGLYKPWQDGQLPKIEVYDALVVLGGEQSAVSDDTHPYLPRLARDMKRAADMGMAVLGICLGSQIFARGLGGQNRLGVAKEFGWCAIDVTDAGRSDPVFAAVPPRFPIFQWHSDTFDLPKGTVHLAGNAAAVSQGFRYGRAGYGMQFHFEASRPVVVDWAQSFPEAVKEISPGWLSAMDHEMTATGPVADAHGLALARAWAALI